MFREIEHGYDKRSKRRHKSSKERIIPVMIAFRIFLQNFMEGIYFLKFYQYNSGYPST